jgi:hypothetical protein
MSRSDHRHNAHALSYGPRQTPLHCFKTQIRPSFSQQNVPGPHFSFVRQGFLQRIKSFSAGSGPIEFIGIQNFPRRTSQQEAPSPQSASDSQSREQWPSTPSGHRSARMRSVQIRP